jgi:dethiobiotin synthetase
VRRIHITGTDTDVGKTHIARAVARALREAGEHPTIVKLVQTGLPAEVPGDASIAADGAGCRALELHRFPLAADPWNAALAAGADPLRAAALAREIERIPGSIVAEGSGGAAIPLNATESLSDAITLCKLETILVVGLRLGCISHTLLTLEYLARREIPLLGAVLCERRPLDDPAYIRQVEHAVGAHCAILGVVPFRDAGACVGARLKGAPPRAAESSAS